ncbi:hypothetical protein V498_07865 [Pseudogymnoascus sp. VKM F-4517 (FW-2822)]|nr:hypothetical protein V498_07865 [Pseudogymnoascus sp. VKM F-4517 (FW-2822)]
MAHEGKKVSSEATAKATAEATADATAEASALNSPIDTSSSSSSSATPVTPLPIPRPPMKLDEVDYKIKAELASLESALSANDFVSISELVASRDMDPTKKQAKLVMNGKILRHYESEVPKHIHELFDLVRIKDDMENIGKVDSAPATTTDEAPTPEVIVDESLLLESGMINMDIADTLKAKTMAEQINATLDCGASLISDLDSSKSN